MDYGHTNVVEEALVTVAEIVAAAQNQNVHAQETTYNVSTPLLSTSMRNGDNTGPTERQDTNISELQSPAHTLLAGLVLFFVAMLPLIIIVASWVYLVASEKDPLGISVLCFLQLFSLAVSAIAVVFLSSIIILAATLLVDALEIPKDRPNRDVSGMMVFMYGLLITYLIFYGTASVWATSRPVDDLLNKHGVYHDFEAKMRVPDALDLLTRCLYDQDPDRFATLDDFSGCLKDVGVRAD